MTTGLWPLILSEFLFYVQFTAANNTILIGEY